MRGIRVMLGALLLCGTALVAHAGNHDIKGRNFDALVAPELVEVGPEYRSLKRFTRVQDALDAWAEKTPSTPVTIAIAPGDYYEKVTVSRAQTTLYGLIDSDGNLPRLYFDAYAAEAGHYHRDNWGTAGSATLTINAADVIIRNLHIDNTFDYLANDARASDDPEKIRHSQAVALLLDVASDRVGIFDSRLDGYQDTLFANGGSAYLYNSRVSGNVDFIFGNGFVVFERCTIVARPRGKTLKPGDIYGHITAPSTDISTPFGLVVIDSRLEREPGVPANSYSLGRPWHPTTTFADGRYADPDAVGSAFFIRTWMDAHIRPEGWASMTGTARDGTKTRVFTPEESRFFERDVTGPGAAEHSARKHLPDAVLAELNGQINRLKNSLPSP